ncbi:C-type lectin 37Da-like [Drosophila takahashii]|uniref:C-type lectin 37Da-like n=1 Tax=Drosophila takahashii TaxID=29030 RepID=UPI0038990233
MVNKLVQSLLVLASFKLGFSCDKCAPGTLNGNTNIYAINSSPFVKINEGFYYFGQEKVNWFRAYESCRKLGSELVTFETPEEFEAVSGYLKDRGERSDHWTSGNDLGHHGTHNWFTNAQPVSINRWAPKQPNNSGGNQRCIHMGYIYDYSTDFQLNDRRCRDHKNSSMKYVCEIMMRAPPSFVVGK